jgi:two-component system, NtrC family, sensor kinase
LSSHGAQVSQPMNREFEARFTAILLTLLTVAAVSFAGFNYKSEHQTAVPDDGAWWMERSGHLVADRLEPNGPAERAGIRRGDEIVSINGRAVETAAAVTHRLYDSGVWSKATYSLIRGSVPLDVEVVVVPAERSMNDWLRLIALIYLGIGLYVLMRRWTAVGSTHFYIFCLVSFVFYSLHYTGKLNAFDWCVLWANEIAWLLQPALFLHFVLTFPGTSGVCGKASLVGSAALLAGYGAAGRTDSGDSVPQSQQFPALQSEPGALGVSDDLLFLGSGGAVEQLPAGLPLRFCVSN